jgi:predicted transposase YdaD
VTSYRGPIYDNALRVLAAADLVALCRWLGIPAAQGSIRISEALPATTHYADLIAKVDEAHLAHVEFVRAPTSTIGQRMLEYRARITALQPGVSLQQHVVVLAAGTVPSRVADGEEFAMRLHVTYLRDHAPAEFLADPSMAPLAVLGRAGSVAERAAVLREALQVVAAVPDSTRRAELSEVAAVLAAIHLDGDTISRAGKEVSMPITLDGTVAGREIEARGEARGEAKGRADAAAALFDRLLRRRFGDDPRITSVAAGLAERAYDDALDLALTATSLDELAGP